MRRCLVLCLMGLASPAVAGPWGFAEPVPVTEAQGEGIFHHLESAGRRNLAACGGSVAVTWEDNRSGGPRVYVAFKSGRGFTRARPVSGQGEAYEPAIVALENGECLIGWEEAGGIWVRRVARQGLGSPIQVAEQGRQATLATGAGRIYMAWSSRRERPAEITVAILRPAGGSGVAVGQRMRPDPGQGPQQYPALAVSGRGVVVAWEDRRHGHTRLYYSFAAHNGGFGERRQLNELPPPRSQQYGEGTGAARPVLVALDERRIAAAWMDKRDFEGGYDVYVAVSRDGGRTFGDNERVQDAFGTPYTQWHPAIAAGPDGGIVVAWDDDREGNPDVWLSRRHGPGQWSQDRTAPGAHGPGHQNQPVILIDAAGRLHLAWLSQPGQYEPTRLWYVQGRGRGQSKRQRKE